MAGSITAALFLRRFVEAPRYAHFDIYGWQPKAAPGRPKGGVGQGARALLAALPELCAAMSDRRTTPANERVVWEGFAGPVSPDLRKVAGEPVAIAAAVAPLLDRPGDAGGRRERELVLGEGFRRLDTAGRLGLRLRRARRLCRLDPLTGCWRRSRPRRPTWSRCARAT